MRTRPKTIDKTLQNIKAGAFMVQQSSGLIADPSFRASEL